MIVLFVLLIYNQAGTYLIFKKKDPDITQQQHGPRQNLSYLLILKDVWYTGNKRRQMFIYLCITYVVVIGFVEFASEGYKIRKIFASKLV